MESQEATGQQETKVRKDQVAHEVVQVLMDLQEQLDSQDPLEHQELQDHQDPSDHPDPQVKMVTQAQEVTLVMPDHEAFKEDEGQMEQQELQD